MIHYMIKDTNGWDFNILFFSYSHITYNLLESFPKGFHEHKTPQSLTTVVATVKLMYPAPKLHLSFTSSAENSPGEPIFLFIVIELN